MRKTLAVTAAAAAAIGAGTAHASSPIVGQLSASMNSGESYIGIMNNSGSTWSNLMLDASWGSCNGAGACTKNAQTMIGTIGSHGYATVALTGPHFASGGSFSAGVMFKIVGNGIFSDSFGNGTGSSNWLFASAGHQSNQTVGLGNVYVPEPATVLLLSAGLVGLGAARRRRRG